MPAMCHMNRATRPDTPLRGQTQTECTWLVVVVYLFINTHIMTNTIGCEWWWVWGIRNRNKSGSVYSRCGCGRRCSMITSGVGRDRAQTHQRSCMTVDRYHMMWYNTCMDNHHMTWHRRPWVMDGIVVGRAVPTEWRPWATIRHQCRGD
jgi:hypothetical protein